DKRLSGTMELMSEGGMKEKIVRVGKKLKHLHQSEDFFLKDLEEVANCLAMLIKPTIFWHEDVRVKIMVVTCIAEVTRVTTPYLPYNDDIMRDIFKHMVRSFQSLWNITRPYYSKRVKILETMAKVNSSVLMVDLGYNDLILHMFEVFFGVIHDNHSKNVMVTIQSIMYIVINKYDDVPQQLLNVLKEELRQEASCISHTLAKGVMNQIKVKTYMAAKSSEKDMAMDPQGMSYLMHNNELFVSNTCTKCEGTKESDPKVMDCSEFDLANEDEEVVDEHGKLDSILKKDVSHLVDSIVSSHQWEKQYSTIHFGEFKTQV
ncbi:hypothetical protein KI387_008441, partial [Taxus chinensis]